MAKPQAAGSPNGQGPHAPSIPPLPRHLLPNIDTTGTGRWFDIYTQYALRVSPMTPKLFHYGAALQLISIVVARRLVLEMSFGNIYPNLWQLWLAPTTIFHKTTALNKPREIALRECPHLLLPHEMTPESMIETLSGAKPYNFDKLPAHIQTLWSNGQNFAAQRALILDELSGLLANAGKDYNAGMIETLMRLFDCDPNYTRTTRKSGVWTIHNAYFPLLGASTPRVMAEHLNSERLWGMGFWPRFAILTPETDQPTWQIASCPVEPNEVADGIRKLLNLFDKPLWPNAAQTQSVVIDQDAFDVWQNYYKATSFDMLTSGEVDNLLYGLYGRLSIQALKVAMLLAAMEWAGVLGVRIELKHMAKAIRVVETWRESAHRALLMVRTTEFDRVQARISRTISKYPNGATLRDIHQQMRDKSVKEIEEAIEQMIALGDVKEHGAARGKPGRPTTRFVVN